MKRKFQVLAALFLTVMMLLSIVPVSAFAEAMEPTPEPTPEVVEPAPEPQPEPAPPVEEPQPEPPPAPAPESASQPDPAPMEVKPTYVVGFYVDGVKLGEATLNETAGYVLQESAAPQVSLESWQTFDGWFRDGNLYTFGSTVDATFDLVGKISGEKPAEQPAVQQVKPSLTTMASVGSVASAASVDGEEDEEPAEPKQYSLTFYDYDGNVHATADATEGESFDVAAIGAPAYTGDVAEGEEAPAFLGWGYDFAMLESGAEENTVLEFWPSFDVPMMAMNLLTPNAVTYTLTYDKNNHTNFEVFPNPASVQYASGTEVVVAYAAANHDGSLGHYFMGWSTDSSDKMINNDGALSKMKGTFYPVGSIIVLNKDTTLFAVYGDSGKVTPPPITITFIAQGPGVYFDGTTDKTITQTVTFTSDKKSFTWAELAVAIPTPKAEDGYTLNPWTSNISYQDPNGVPGTFIIDGTTGHIRFVITATDVPVPPIVDITVQAGSASKAYDGQPLTHNALENPRPVGLKDGHTIVPVITGSITDPGTTKNELVSITIVDEGGNNVTSQYNPTLLNGTLEVTTNGGIVTITTPSDSKPYDGTALTAPTFSFSGLPTGFTVEITVTGSQTAVGSSKNTVNESTLVIKNGAGEIVTGYFTNVSYQLGVLEVTTSSAAVIVTTASASKVYDGTALTKTDEYTVTGIPADHTYTITVTGTQTAVGSSENTVDLSTLVIKNAAGINVTTNFTNIGTNLGTLTVTESDGTVIVTTQSATKQYDGTALTNGSYTITGIPSDHTATITVTGSQTEVGDSDNTVDKTSLVIKNAAGIDVTTSFTNVGYSLGTLLVTKNSGLVTIHTPDATKAYDGTALTAGPATTTDLPAGFTIEIDVTGTQTIVGDSPNTVDEDTLVIRNANNEDVTENFTNVVYDLGTLVVTGATITIKTEGATKTYDGTALTNGEHSFTGIPDGHTAAITVTGSQTAVGSSDNTVDMDTLTITNADGVDVTAYFTTVNKDLGTLLVTASNGTVTVTTPTDSKPYDGTALTAGPAVITGIPDDHTATITVNGSQTAVGSSTNTVDKDTLVIRNAADEDVTEYFTGVIYDLGTLTVTETDVEVIIATPDASKPYDGTALTAGPATPTGLPTGHYIEIDVTGSQTAVGSSFNTVDEDTLVIRNAAGDDVTVYFTNVDYDLGTLTVTETDVEVVITTPDATKAYDGTALTAPTFTYSGLPTGFTVEITVTGSQTAVGISDNTVDTTTLVIKNAAGLPVTEAFTNVVYRLGTLDVTANTDEITITTPDATKAYDGTALTAGPATPTGLPTGHYIEIDVTGSQTAVGSSFNTVDEATLVIRNADDEDVTAFFGTPNYDLGTLTVTASTAQVVVTTQGGSKQYDGTPLTNGSYTVTGIPTDHTGIITVTGSQTAVGESYNTVDTATLVIRNADEEDVTSFFGTPTYNLGKLVVTENDDSIVITTLSASKPYDGTALTAPTFTFSGLPANHTVEITVTGSQTAVGDSDNTVDKTTLAILDAGNNDVTANFTNVTYNLGTLLVTKTDVEVTVTTESATKEYDGTALTETGNAVSGLPENHSGSITTTGSQTAVGDSDNTVDKTTLAILDADNNDVTENFTNITYDLGKLVVTPNTSPVTVTTESAKKVYDGTALTKKDATVGGLPGGHSGTITVTGTQTAVGTSVNTVDEDTLVILNAANENVTTYFSNIVYDLGTLEVTRLTINLVDENTPETEEPDENGNINVRLQVGTHYKTYGNQDPPFGFEGDPIGKLKTLLGETLGSTFTATATRNIDTGEDVRHSGGGYGTYVVDGELTTIDANITIKGTVIPGSLTINPLPVHIVPNADSKQYNQPDPPLTATETYATPNGAKPTGWGQFTPANLIYTVVRTPGEDVGSYQLSISYSAAANPNYLITTGALGGTEPQFIINPEGTLTISIADGTKVYGDADPDSFMDRVTVGGLVGNDTAALLNISIVRAAGENVGEYDYVVRYDVPANYEKVDVIYQGRFSITPRPITLVANSFTITEGTAIPAFSYYVSTTAGRGLASTDTTLSLSLYQAPAGTTAGTYGILFNLGSNPNYQITVVNGTLTINAPTGGGTTDPGGDPGPGGPGGGDPGTTVVPTVVPAGPVAVVAAPPAPAPADAPAPVEIAPAPTPAAEPTVTVDDLTPEEVPLAPFTGAWALLNLMIAVLTLVFAVLLFAFMFKRNKKRDESEDEKQARMAAEAARGEEPEDDVRNRRSGMLWRVVSILAGVLAPIVFLLTENMNNPMVFTDRWTLLMAIILVVQVLSMLLLRHARNKEDKPEEDEVNA